MKITTILFILFMAILFVVFGQDKLVVDAAAVHDLDLSISEAIQLSNF